MYGMHARGPLRNPPARVCDLGLHSQARIPRIRLTGRDAAKGQPGTGAPWHEEDDVKELSFEEVLRIPGGRPFAAALDELTYRSPVQSVADPIDYAHSLGALRSPSDRA
jgi:hypothetical protein